MNHTKNKKWLFIVNPISGNGAAVKRLPKLKESIAKYKIDADIHLTEYKKHATEIAKENINKYEIIISVGGDGTHNEVLQSLIGEDIIFGAISAGSGNDFIHALGFSENFTEDEYKIFFKENIISLDVGKCNDKYFINAFGVGYDAYVAHDMERMSLGGTRNKIHYLTSVLKNLLFYKPTRMEVKINGETKQIEALLATVGNGKRVGGGFYLTPHALVNDNLFDICIIYEQSIINRINIFGKVIKKLHASSEKVWYVNSGNVVLEYKKNVPFHIDGEVEFGKYFDISLIPYKLKVIYNPTINKNNYLK